MLISEHASFYEINYLGAKGQLLKENDSSIRSRWCAVI